MLLSKSINYLILLNIFLDLSVRHAYINFSKDETPPIAGSHSPSHFSQIAKTYEPELGSITMSDTACKTCAFFEIKAAETDAKGECRFNPPTFLTEAEHKGMWPVVKSDDWCGQFEQDAA